MSKIRILQSWPTKKLNDLEKMGIVELGRGNVISKRTIEQNPGDYPIYSSSQQNEGEFGRYGGYIFDEELVTWSVDGGGKFFYRPKHKYSVTNVCGWMRVLKPDVLNCQFLYFALDICHRKFNFDYTFKAHPSVIRKMYKVPLPPIEIQRKIVERLDAVKKAQELNENQIKLTEELFQSLLNKELNPKGKNWKVKKLGEVSQIENGGTPSTKEPEYWEGDILWLTPKELSGFEDIEVYDTERRITKLGLGRSSAKLLPIGAVLLTSRAPIGYVAIAGKPLATNQGFKNFICDRKILNNKFLYYLLRYKIDYIKSLGRGATFGEVSKNIVSNLKIPLPALEIQQKIVGKLSVVQDYKKKLLEQKQKLQELFESVLNKSIKGELI